MGAAERLAQTNQAFDKLVSQSPVGRALRAILYGGRGPATQTLVERGVATGGTLNTFAGWQMGIVDQAWGDFHKAKSEAGRLARAGQEVKPPSPPKVTPEQQASQLHGLIAEHVAKQKVRASEVGNMLDHLAHRAQKG